MNTPTPTLPTVTVDEADYMLPTMTPTAYLKRCEQRQPPQVILPNAAQTEVLCEIAVTQGSSSGAGHTINVWRGFEARTPTATLEACKRNGWITDTFRDGYALTPLGRFVLDAALAAAHAALRPAAAAAS